MHRILALSTLLLAACSTSRPTLAPEGVKLKVADTLPRLLSVADTDQDQKITIKDKPAPFTIEATDGSREKVEGSYQLSVLLQELSLASARGEEAFTLRPEIFDENPAVRTSRLIAELFWDGLTRRLDAEGLAHTLQDTKTATADGAHFLYVPAKDTYAWNYYRDIARRRPDLRLELRRVPRNITPAFFRSLDGKHGLLALKVQKDPQTGKPAPVPYVVPGGRFNEMYGWDSYFITLGLLNDGKFPLARAMVENHAYQIEHYGKILNANRSYYLTRTQPPFFTAMLRAVYEASPKTAADRAWLQKNLALAIQEYREVWESPPRLIKEHGLSRYFDEGDGPGPEVEPGGYDALLAPIARAAGLSPREYLKQYEAGKIRSDATRLLFKHDRTVRETGHDTTYRFDQRAADFLTVDLNSLLYRYETDIAELLNEVFGGSARIGKRTEEAKAWAALANKRRERIQALLWDEGDGFYYDYDLKKGERSGYVSATGLFPLWAGISTPEQARRVYQLAKEELVLSEGLAATSLKSRGPLNPPERPQRQWDYPYGWPPHQMMVWEGLRRMGLEEQAEQLAFDWVYTIAKNARDFNGMVTEKYDVEKGSHEAFAEYGNVGSDFSYITKEGFGWTNASYQLGLKFLSPNMRARLETDVAPE